MMRWLSFSLKALFTVICFVTNHVYLLIFKGMLNYEVILSFFVVMYDFCCFSTLTSEGIVTNKCMLPNLLIVLHGMVWSYLESWKDFLVNNHHEQND